MADSATKGVSCKASINGTSMTIISSTLKKTTEHRVRDGISGDIDQIANDVREDGYMVAGQLVLEPSPEELLALATLAVADPPTEFDVVLDIDGEGHTAEDCVINVFTLTGSEGGILRLTLDLIGKTWTDTGVVAAPASAAPYIFSDVVLTIATVARAIMEFTLAVNNNMAGKKRNNKTVSVISREDRRAVTLGINCAYNADNADLKAVAVAGLAGSMAVSDGTTTTTFTFGKLQTANETPDIGKGEIMLPVNFAARKSGATVAIAVA